MADTTTTAPPVAPQRKSVFRQQALNSLSAPSDQLDTLLRVTSARGWLVLVALVAVVAATVLYGFVGAVPTTVSAQGLFIPPGGLIDIEAPRSGTVTSLAGRVGSVVKVGDPIGTIAVSERDSYVVRATEAGMITETLIDEGNYIAPGQAMAILEPTGSGANAVVYVAAGEGKAITTGMAVHLSPSTAPSEQYGQIEGVVTSVSEFPVSPRRLQFVLQNAALVQSMVALGSVLEVNVNVTTDPDTTSGLKWTSGNGPPFLVGNGTLTSASVILDQESPAGKLFNPNE
ncbi:MAG TPA: HlyD family efflux transporter periplasmic adaptor subunit [Propionibacteriaceae bacterium]